MAFGINITTDSGELILSEKYLTPSLLGKIPLILTQTTAFGSIEGDCYSYSYSPAGSGVLSFLTLPSGWPSGVYSIPGSVSFENEFQPPTGTVITVVRPSSVPRESYAVPEAYLFGTPSGPSTENMGFRVWKDNGTIAFDTGFKPLQIIGIPSLTYPSVETPLQQNTVLGVPTKPAFFIPPSGYERWVKVTGQQLSNGSIYLLAARRDSNVLTLKFQQVAAPSEDSAYNGNIVYGSSPTVAPMINAANYD